MSERKPLPDNRELYFEIGAEGGGEDLFRVKKDDGSYYFFIGHNNYDFDTDEPIFSYKEYSSFEEYFSKLTRMEGWFMLHPLYIHPEARA